jgi:hypothetical protein
LTPTTAEVVEEIEISYQEVSSTPSVTNSFAEMGSSLAKRVEAQGETAITMPLSGSCLDVTPTTADELAFESRGSSPDDGAHSLDPAEKSGSETDSSDDDYMPSPAADVEYEDFFDDDVDAELDGTGIFLEQKRDRTATGRRGQLVAEKDPAANGIGGRIDPEPQPVREYASKPATSSPICVYDNVTCTCTVDAHRRKPTLPPSSPEHVDDDCRILAHLGLSFHKYHRFIICPCYDGSFVPLGSLKSHLKAKHHASLRRSSGQLVIQHIATSFDIPPLQQSVVFVKETFNGPISGIAQPILCFVCPICDGHFRSRQCVATHYREKCRQISGNVPLDVKSLRTQLTQSPFAFMGNRSKRVQVEAPLDPSSHPSTTRTRNHPPQLEIEPYVAPRGVDMAVPLWLKKLGWAAWRDGLLKAGFSILSLRALVALPRCPSKETVTLDRVLYLAKQHIHRRLVAMLQDANTWLDQSNSELRTSLTAGSLCSYFSHCAALLIAFRTRSSYRLLHKASYDKYGRFFTRILLALLRFGKLRENGSLLRLPRNDRQEKAIDALAAFIFDGHVSLPENGEPECRHDSALDERLFAVLEALFYQILDPTRAVGCPMDFLVMATWLSPGGSNIKASNITQHCAIVQYWARTTVVHSLRLAYGRHPTYVPLEGTADLDNEIIRDGVEGAGGSAKCVMSLTVSSYAPNFFSQSPLDELRCYILPSAANSLQFTPFSHSKHFWLLAGNASRHERSFAKMTWSVCKTEFEYSRPGLPTVSITLTSFRQLVHHNQFVLFRLFESLLPSTYTPSTVESLPWASLRDDGDAEASFLDSTDVWNSWLKSATASLVRAYLDPAETKHRILVHGKPSIKAMTKLLDLDQKFQAAVVCETIGDTGISPRAVTIRDYRYRTDAAEQRNVRLVQGDVVLYGGRQKGESRRDGFRELVLRAFCPRVGRCLVQYLALVRRAIIEILKAHQWYTDAIPAYTTRLLAMHVKGRRGAWAVSDITGAWRDASCRFLNAKLSIVDMRQIGTGVFHELFPDLIREPSNTSMSAIHGQGDHGRLVTDRYYGRNSDACHGLPLAEVHDYILASKVLQALMQVIPVDDCWPVQVRQSRGLDHGHYEALAVAHADYLVPVHYGFRGLPATAVRLAVKELCTQLPFLFSRNVRSVSVCRVERTYAPRQHTTDEIHLSRDRVLLEVTSMLAWGEAGPQALSQLPSGVDTISKAVLIVRYPKFARLLQLISCPDPEGP